MLARLLAALVRIALAGDADEAAGWRAEALEAQREVVGLAGGIDPAKLDGVWSGSVGVAEQDAAVRRDETVNPMLPTVSPLRPDQLAAVPFDLDDAVRIIREAASFG